MEVMEVLFVKYCPFYLFWRKRPREKSLILIKREIGVLISFFFIILLVSFSFLKIFPVFGKEEINLPFTSPIKIFILFLLLFLYLYISLFIKKKRIWIKYLPILFFLYLQFGELLSTLEWFSTQSKKTSESDKVFGEIIELIFNIFFLIIFFILNKEYTKNIFRIIKTKPIYFILILFIIIIYNFLMHLEYFFNSSFSKILKSSTEQNESENEKIISGILKDGSQISKWILIIKIIIVAPIYEEIFYRYFIYLFFGKNNFFFFILVSMFLFSTAHMHEKEYFKYIADNKIDIKYLFKYFKSIFNFLFLGIFWHYWYFSYLMSIVFVLTKTNLIFPILFHFSSNVIVLFSKYIGHIFN